MSRTSYQLTGEHRIGEDGWKEWRARRSDTLALVWIRGKRLRKLKKAGRVLPLTIAQERDIARELVESGLPDKPRYRQPCNHCGLCCTVALCYPAMVLHPDREGKGPCPYMVREPGKILCGLVATERRAGLEPRIEMGLGIGNGCSMVDEEPTKQEKGLYLR